MDMRSFILHGDIHSVKVKINGSDYRFGVNGKHLKSLMVILGY